MWDAERKVGALNDFDLTKLADQEGASGEDNTGTLPFMALDLLSEEGLRGDILRLYRHEAESFAWSLIRFCLSAVENEKGENCTRVPHPLQGWFEGWTASHDGKWDSDGTSTTHPTFNLFTQTQRCSLVLFTSTG